MPDLSACIKISKRPMLLLGCSFAAGILVSAHLGVYFFASLIILLCGALLFLWLRPGGYYKLRLEGNFIEPNLVARLGVFRCLVTLGVAIFAFGYWRYDQVEQQLTDNALKPDTSYEAVLEVTSPPEQMVLTGSSEFYSAKGRVVSLNSSVMSESLPVYLYGRDGHDIKRGSVFTGRIYSYFNRAAVYPGGFNYTDYLANMGLSGRVLLKDGSWQDASGGILQNIRRYIDSVRSSFIQNTLHQLPDQDGAFLAAALFGYKKSLSDDTREMFRDVGISHVLAISGLHVGLVCAIIWFVCQLFFNDRRIIAMISIAGCLAYLALSGGHTAAARAGIIAIIYLLGFVFKRRSDFLNSLGAAGLIILIYNPYNLFALGFQLSFAAVIFIACFFHEVSQFGFASNDEVQDYKLSGKITRKIHMMLCLSVSAWLGVLPLTLYAFHKLAFSGLFINVIAIPAMSFALGGGMLLQFAPFLPDSVLPAFSFVCALPSNFLLCIAHYGEMIPGGGVSSFMPPLWSVFIYYIAFAVFFCRRIFSNAKITAVISSASIPLITLALVLVFYFGFSPAKPSPGVDVITGKFGETAVVVTPAGKVVVAGFIQREGEDILKYLAYRRIGKIDTLVVLNSRDSEEVAVNFKRNISCGEVYYGGDISSELELDVLSRLELFRFKGEVLAWQLEFDSERIFFSNWLWPEQFRKIYNTADFAFVKIRGRRKIEVNAKTLYRRGAVTTGRNLNHISRVSIIKNGATKAAPYKR